MRLAFVVLAHRAPDQVARLITALRDPASRIYLHIDSRADLAAFSRAIEGADVILRRRPTRWGGPELVDVVLDGLAQSLTDGCDYVLLISGQDFPLRTPREMTAFLGGTPDRSYIEHWSLPYDGWRLAGRDRTDFYTFDFLGRRETCIPAGEDVSHLSWSGRLLNRLLRLRTIGKPPRRTPAYVRPVGGSQWLNLSRSAVQHIVQFTEDHPDYRHYHEHTLAPDELFFHSLLLGTDFADEHEIVNDNLRYMVWPPGAAPHPRVLTMADLPAMRSSHALFARKLDADVDAALLTELETLLPQSPSRT